MFTAANKELGGNFMDVQFKTIVVNATWFQTMAIGFLQSFMDKEATKK